MTKTSNFKPDALGEYIKPGSGEKKQKHEKIEKMALELYKTQFSLADGIDDKLKRLRICWLTAEMFYDFAKQKQEENV